MACKKHKKTILPGLVTFTDLFVKYQPMLQNFHVFHEKFHVNTIFGRVTEYFTD